MTQQNYWRRCGPCKKEIPFSSDYYQCSVSSCRKQTFCSVECFRAHVPIMRHKDAWAEENKSPASLDEPTRRIVTASSSSQATPKDVLVVASKLKAYIKESSGLSTSNSVLERLSTLIRVATDQAVEEAKKDGRKTVMDRDYI